MKHVMNKHNVGNIAIDKCSLGDLAELIRISPTSARLLLCLANNADSDNELITDMNTLHKLLGVSIETINYAVKKLFSEGFIDISQVKLKSEHDIYKYIHDDDLYEISKKTIWKVIGKEFVDKYTVSGTFNKIWVNSNIIKCSDNTVGNILLNVKGRIFYDTEVKENEIIWEM